MPSAVARIAADLPRAPLLELPGGEAEAAGEVQDPLPGALAHQAPDGIPLGVLQRGGPHVGILFAAHRVILYCLRHTGFLLVLLQLTCGTRTYASRAIGKRCVTVQPAGARGVTTVTGSEDQPRP
jgi:hypothetical protein